jgi:ABC-type proline/glycine betaine transport system permease subunit
MSTNPVPARVSLRGVERTFGTHTVLRDVDIEIEPGEVVALLGASGSGKSTLLRLIAGLDRPNAGRIEIDGEGVRGIDPRCAVVFQEPRLLPWRSLAANVEYGLPPGTARSAWVPLLLLWFGIDETPKILIVAIGAFFPIYTTTASALSHVDPQLLEVGRAYGRNGASLLTTVMLPAAAPELVNGLRLGLANAWLFVVAAELIASSKGLGFLLFDSQNTGRTDVMLLAIVLLAALGKLSDALLGAVEHRMVRQRS